MIAPTFTVTRLAQGDAVVWRDDAGLLRVSPIVADTTAEPAPAALELPTCAACGARSGLLDHEDRCPACAELHSHGCQCVTCRGDLPAEEGA